MRQNLADLVRGGSWTPVIITRAVDTSTASPRALRTTTFVVISGKDCTYYGKPAVCTHIYIYTPQKLGNKRNTQMMQRDRRVMCVAQQLPAAIRRVCVFLVQVSPISALHQTNVMNNPVLSTTFLSLLLFQQVASPSGSQETKTICPGDSPPVGLFLSIDCTLERIENTGVQMFIAWLHGGPDIF